MSYEFSVRALPNNPIRAYQDFRRDPIQFLMKTADLGDVVRIPSVTFRPSFIVHHPDLIRFLLTSSAKDIVKGTSSQILGITLGDGLLTSEDPTHARQRKALQPAFHNHMLVRAMDTMVAAMRDNMAGWSSESPVSISEAMLNVTLDVIFVVLFGQSADANLRRTIHESVSQSVSFSAKRLMSPLPVPYAIPLRSHQRQRRAVSQLDFVAETVLRCAERTGGGALLPLLDGVDDSEARNQIKTFIVAGHETTANLMTWMLAELSRRPNLVQQMQNEIDAIADTDWLTSDALRTLSFTRNVVKETLRLYPPAWTMLRETVREVAHGNVRFPRNASIIISPYVMHRNPRWFTEPDVFHPDRFAGESANALPPYAYIPFGGGNRSCIGHQFAQVEATVLIATVLRHFTPCMTEAAPVHPEPSVSLRIRGGLKLAMIPRH